MKQKICIICDELIFRLADNGKPCKDITCMAVYSKHEERKRKEKRKIDRIKREERKQQRLFEEKQMPKYHNKFALYDYFYRRLKFNKRIAGMRKSKCEIGYLEVKCGKCSRWFRLCSALISRGKRGIGLYCNNKCGNYVKACFYNKIQ